MENANISRFEAELSRVNRPGMDALFNYLRSSDMYRAPASGRYHLSVPGGLVQHSLNVLDVLRGSLKHNADGTYSMMIAGCEAETVTEENVIVMALLHDICKTNFYSASSRNRKNEETGQWEKYLYYEIEDKMPLGHGEKSVMMLQEFIKLDKCEAYAIRWHMGPPEGSDRYSFDQAVDLHPVVWALHSADMMASHFLEDKEGNKITPPNTQEALW